MIQVWCMQLMKDIRKQVKATEKHTSPTSCSSESDVNIREKDKNCIPELSTLHSNGLNEVNSKIVECKHRCNVIKRYAALQTISCRKMDCQHMLHTHRSERLLLTQKKSLSLMYIKTQNRVKKRKKLKWPKFVN